MGGNKSEECTLCIASVGACVARQLKPLAALMGGNKSEDCTLTELDICIPVTSPGVVRVLAALAGVTVPSPRPGVVLSHGLVLVASSIAVPGPGGVLVTLVEVAVPRPGVVGLLAPGVVPAALSANTVLTSMGT